LKKTYRLSSVLYTRPTVCKPMSTVGRQATWRDKSRQRRPPTAWRPVATRRRPH